MSTTEIEFFTPDPVEDGGWLRKEDLLGKLVAYVVRDYKPQARREIRNRTACRGRCDRGGGRRLH